MTLNELLAMDVNEARKFLTEFNRKFEPTEDDIRAKVKLEFDKMLNDDYWKDKFDYYMSQVIIAEIKENSYRYIREMHVKPVLDELTRSKEFEDKIKERISADVKKLITKIN